MCQWTLPCYRWFRAGKTVTLRSIAYELAKQNYPVLLIDFHGDMAPDSSVKTYKIKEGDGYYFNPLELSNKFEDLTPLRATSDFVDAIKINFSSLGIQQIDRLTELITEGYNNNNPSSNKSAGEFNFDELNNKIFNSDDGKSDGLRAYLRGMSDYKLFSGNQKISVESFLEPGISHINLNSLPENLRNLFADLLLRKLYYSLQSLGNISEGDISDKDKFRIFVIVDEAKLLVSDKQGSKAVLNKYATELRKSGLGLILASQLIGHFNEEILANMSAKIFMKAETKEQANKNARHFNVDPKALLKFKPGEAEFVLNNEYQHLKIIPMSERLKE